MVKAKKDMLGQKLYKSLKKHSIVKDPIVLIYSIAIIVVIVSYIIYLIYKETI